MTSFLLLCLLHVPPTAPTSWTPQSSAAGQNSCDTWQACRDQALEAASRHDYETFHDLAWRMVQKGPPHDPDLMYILARAQALSGRPDDALVMLQRLAEMGVVTDAIENDDFRNARALARWPEVKAAIEAAAAVPPAAAPVTAPETPRKKAASKPVEAPAPVKAPDPPAASKPAAPVPSTPEAPAPEPGEEALRFDTTLARPAGLAYDAVSKRFVVGDPAAHKLIVVDEVSHRAVNLVSAASAGFYPDITAFEIDPRRGDLWVVSTNDPDAAAEPASVLHKLQLVSGRPLEEVKPAADAGAVHFADVAVTDGGSVLVLDSAGSRIFRLGPGSRAIVVARTIDLAGATTIAPLNERTLYAAGAAGIVRLDLESTAAPAHVRAAKTIDLSGLEKMRWHRGALVGMQHGADGRQRVVKIHLNRQGTRVVGLDVLDPAVETSGPTAIALSGSDLYYLTGGDGPTEGVVRRLTLR